MTVNRLSENLLPRVCVCMRARSCVCVCQTCSEARLLLAVAEVAVGIVLQPTLLLSLLGGDPGLGDPPCAHRLHAPVLPLDHVGNTTLGHGCGLGHPLLHSPGHPCIRWSSQKATGGGSHVDQLGTSNPGWGGVETEKYRRLVIIGSLVPGCVFGGDVMNEGLWNNGSWMMDGCPAVAASRKRATGQEVFGSFH